MFRGRMHPFTSISICLGDPVNVAVAAGFGRLTASSVEPDADSLPLHFLLGPRLQVLASLIGIGSRRRVTLGPGLRFGCGR